MRSIAIIPARAGSKRIPGKNLCDVGGSSLLDRAIGSGSVCDCVVVSTDDPAIDVRRLMQNGVMFHRRKPEHATDAAQLEPVIADVLAELGDGFDAIVLLQPTSPFRTAEHVSAALALLADGVANVVSVTRLHSLAPCFSGEVLDGWYYVRTPSMERLASSALGHLCYENGAIYAFTREWWDANQTRMAPASKALVMHWSEAVEIDTPEDLEAARRMAGPGMAGIAVSASDQPPTTYGERRGPVNGRAKEEA